MGVVGHRVDRKIAAAGEVVGHRGDKFHPVGMAVVGIAPLGAEGGDFIPHPIDDYRHRPVIDAGRDDPLVRKTRRRLLRPGAGADIPIVKRRTAQAVAHAAAHHVSLIPGLLQAAEQPGRGRAVWKLSAACSPS